MWDRRLGKLDRSKDVMVNFIFFTSVSHAVVSLNEKRPSANCTDLKEEAKVDYNRQVVLQLNLHSF